MPVVRGCYTYSIDTFICKELTIIIINYRLSGEFFTHPWYLARPVLQIPGIHLSAIPEQIRFINIAQSGYLTIRFEHE
jgi:hypothetical protein